VSQDADEFDVEGMDRSAATPLSARAGDQPTSTYWPAWPATKPAPPRRSISTRLARVATARDQAIILEFQSQGADDTSPNRTVARRHDVTPAVVRQVVCRVRAAPCPWP
jgi:hypothetical protein